MRPDRIPCRGLPRSPGAARAVPHSGGGPKERICFLRHNSRGIIRAFRDFLRKNADPCGSVSGRNPCLGVSAKFLRHAAGTGHQIREYFAIASREIQVPSGSSPPHCRYARHDMPAKICSGSANSQPPSLPPAGFSIHSGYPAEFLSCVHPAFSWRGAYSWSCAAEKDGISPPRKKQRTACIFLFGSGGVCPWHGVMDSCCPMASAPGTLHWRSI